MMRSFEPTAGHEAVRCKAAARHCAVLLTAALIAWSTLATNAPAAAGAAPPPARSPGCSVTGQPTGMLNGQTRVRGESRTYLMQVPANYQASRAYPLIFVFHGAGGNGRQAYGWGLQNAAGAADNAIFVYPDAITFQHYGIGWDDGPDGHDLPFFDGMLKDIEATRCIDTSRVFAAGFSWGGDFVITLACHRGDVIRAVAANSTDDEYNDTKDYRTYQGLPCRSHQHPPVRFEHAQGGDTEYPPPDFATTSKLFQYLNSCGGGSVPAKSSSRAMSCVSFQSCASEYTECIFDAHIGHTLPPNWAADTWDFLSRF
jgi:poly(3-hydroxybutyrate) depolymerase